MRPALFIFCLSWACGEADPASEPAPADAAGLEHDGAAGHLDAAAPRSDAGAEADATPDATPPDLTEAVFDETHLIEVAVELDPADWETLRNQARGDLDRRGADCLSQPFPSPYDWFEGEVTVDGQRYEQVGVRKKGFFGSVSANRPSLKIRFDKYVEQTHEGLTRLTLNNVRQDPSLMRTCLSYDLFRRVGAPTPRCNFAHLTVNGEDYGVFVHVEALKKPFLRRHFADDEGNLYEGTLSDFRDGWSGTIEQKTNESTPDRRVIEALTQAAEAPDDELLEALDAVMDLDAFITFWATEVLVAHWDGYAGNTNNFWFYDDPQRGVVFIPWGPDATFQPPRLLFEGRRAPDAVLAIGVLTRRLYLHPEGQARYLDRVQRVLAEHWSAERMRGQIERWTALVTPALAPWQAGPHAGAVAELRAWIEGQPGRVLGAIISGPEPWDVPLRGDFCLVEAGPLSGGFDTTWGSWPTRDAFQTGEGSWDGALWDRPFEVTQVGAAAGIGERGEAMLLIPARLEGERLVFLYVGMKPEDLAVGTLGADDFECTVNEVNLEGGGFSPLASCPAGELVFEQAARRPGAPVRGRFDLQLYASPPAQ